MVGMFSMVDLSSARRRRHIENLRFGVVMHDWLFLVRNATFESETQRRLLARQGTQQCRPILQALLQWEKVQTLLLQLYTANHQQTDLV